MTTPASEVATLAPLSRIGDSTPKENCGSAPNEKGCWQLLSIAFTITIVACLLCRSGNVESNPGPPECECGSIHQCQVISYSMYAVDLVPGNLEKVCDLVGDASSKWFDLGVQLHIKVAELRVIEMKCTDIGSCFKEMILTWLRMVDPPPSSEGLMTALEHDSVECGDLATHIRQRFGISRQPENAAVKEPETTRTSKPSASSEFIIVSTSQLFGLG